MPVPKYGQPMKHHKLALLPSLSTEEYRALKVSVLTYGVRLPITMYQGQILDGRARWNICREAGLECPTHDYDGDTPLDEMFRLNVHRHYSFETRKQIMLAVLLVEPNRSNRDIGRLARIDKAYIGRERRRLLEEGKLAPPKPKPKPIKRLVRPITQRLDEARELLDEGHDLHEVAAKLGCRGSYLKEQLKLRGYHLPAGTTFSGRGALDRRSGRIIEESVNALVAVAQGLTLVDLKKLDVSPEQAVALLRDVHPAMKSINRAIAKLREVSNVASSNQVIVNSNEG